MRDGPKEMGKEECALETGSDVGHSNNMRGKERGKTEVKAGLWRVFLKHLLISTLFGDFNILCCIWDKVNNSQMGLQTRHSGFQINFS